MDYVTTASTGDATDFGDLEETTQNVAALSSPTRMVMGGGNTPSNINTIQYITISSTGDTTDFGDLTVGRATYGGRGSNQTRGVFSGGYSGSDSNVMDYITIGSTGNATDFGDLITQRRGAAGSSNGHGGLS